MNQEQAFAQIQQNQYDIDKMKLAHQEQISPLISIQRDLYEAYSREHSPIKSGERISYRPPGSPYTGIVEVIRMNVLIPPTKWEAYVKVISTGSHLAGAGNLLWITLFSDGSEWSRVVQENDLKYEKVQGY